ncbi:hypothetical protein Zm00014a_039480 [Zea mays]
MSKKL